MNPYEEFVTMLKGNRGTKKEIFKGIMIESNICKIGENELDENDLLIAEHLKTGYMTDIGQYIKPLQKSDIVLVLKLNDEKYVITERLV